MHHYSAVADGASGRTGVRYLHPQHVGLFCLPLLTLHLIVHIVIREQYFYIF